MLKQETLKHCGLQFHWLIWSWVWESLVLLIINILIIGLEEIFFICRLHCLINWLYFITSHRRRYLLCYLVESCCWLLYCRILLNGLIIRIEDILNTNSTLRRIMIFNASFLGLFSLKVIKIENGQCIKEICKYPKSSKSER